MSDDPDEYQRVQLEVPPGAHVRVEHAPPGAVFRSFPNADDEPASFIACICEGAMIDPIMPAIGVLKAPNFSAETNAYGVGYGRTAAQALRNALAAYKASAEKIAAPPAKEPKP